MPLGRRKVYVANDWLSTVSACVSCPRDREKKLLRHVAMVAKFLDDTNRKRHLKSEFALFQT